MKICYSHIKTSQYIIFLFLIMSLCVVDFLLLIVHSYSDEGNYVIDRAMSCEVLLIIQTPCRCWDM